MTTSAVYENRVPYLKVQKDDVQGHPTSIVDHWECSCNVKQHKGPSSSVKSVNDFTLAEH